jgi:hypothetical protein
MVFILSIGDITCSVDVHNSEFSAILQTRYRHFLSTEPPEYRISINLKPLNELGIPGNQELNQPQITIKKDKESYLIQRIDNPFIARLNKDLRKLEVTMRESQYCFDSFLRVLFIVLLAEDGGLLLHACSIDDKGRGRVFFGPSEAGKTTIARLAGGARVLSDELSIIRPYRGKYFIYGTPFWGEFKTDENNNNYKVELKGLYSLVKDSITGISPIEKVAAIQKLFRCVLYFGNVTEISESILESCVSLAEKVPVYNLNFRQDTSFWNIIDK